MKRCIEYMLSDFFDVLLLMNNLLHKMDENWFIEDMMLVMYIRKYYIKFRFGMN
jgi:hypothetical protein